MLTFLFLSFALFASSEPIRIGIVDTGFVESVFPIPICKDGHVDFTVRDGIGKVGLDTHGHGTHMAGLIHQRASGIILGGLDVPVDLKAKRLEQLKKTDAKDYCMVIFKVMDTDTNKNYYGNFIDYAPKISVDVLNISLEGYLAFPGEKTAFEKLIKRGVKVIVAAGNSRRELNEYDLWVFPASYEAVTTVAGYSYPSDDGPYETLPANYSRSFTSNYGKIIDVWMPGEYQTSTSVGNRLESATGTSQATANYTGYWVFQELKKREKNKNVIEKHY